jgi:hypothetical protein
MIKRLSKIKYGVDFDESISSEEVDALDGLSSLGSEELREVH